MLHNKGLGDVTVHIIALRVCSRCEVVQLKVAANILPTFCQNQQLQQLKVVLAKRQAFCGISIRGTLTSAGPMIELGDGSWLEAQNL